MNNLTNSLELAHIHLEESARIHSDIQSMLSALPTTIPNHYDAIVRYLTVDGRWSLPDISGLAPTIIHRRAKDRNDCPLCGKDMTIRPGAVYTCNRNPCAFARIGFR